jgi:hypothetical protein
MHAFLLVEDLQQILFSRLLCVHYRKQGLHCEPEGSPRAKDPALGANPLRREHQVPLSAKAWLMVQSRFAESILASALGEGLS